MDKTIKRYYRRRQHGGRGFAARILDSAALALVFVAACYLWFRYNVPNQIGSVALTAITTLLFACAAGLWRSIAFERFIVREQARLADIVLRERLLLLPAHSFKELCLRAADGLDNLSQSFLWPTQQASPLEEDALLRAYHQAQAARALTLIICSLSPLSEKGSALLTRLPIETIYLGPDALLCAAGETPGLSISDADVEAYIFSETEAEKDRRNAIQSMPFAAGNAKKYLLCSLLLLGVSFFAGYALYYRLLSGVCLTLATTTWLLNRTGKPQPIEQTN